jgi:hypothetical protein
MPQRCSSVLTCNRHTLEPAAATTPASGANRRIRHHPPADCELLLNGLAASELRRMFCRDEGACVRLEARAGETVARSTDTPAHTLQRSVANAVHQAQRFKGSMGQRSRQCPPSTVQPLHP